MKNKNKTKIVFVSEYDGFDNIKELRPYPASEFMPDWFRQMPAEVKLPAEDFTVDGYIRKKIPNIRTAKLCPSFVDIYNEGFVLPAPCDIWLRVEEDGTWEYRLSNPLFSMEDHGNHQYVYHNKGNVKHVFKLTYPYNIIVPKGYSIRQIPMFYDYNPEWHLAYGIFEADKMPEISVQLLYTSEDNEVVIKAGTPLGYYVPFKREKFSMEIGDYNEYRTKILEGWHRGVTAFKNSSRKFLSDKSFSSVNQNQKYKVPEGYRDARKKET